LAYSSPASPRTTIFVTPPDVDVTAAFVVVVGIAVDVVVIPAEVVSAVLRMDPMRGSVSEGNSFLSAESVSFFSSDSSSLPILKFYERRPQHQIPQNRNICVNPLFLKFLYCERNIFGEEF
jgi:hypothetical protein